MSASTGLPWIAGMAMVCIAATSAVAQAPANGRPQIGPGFDCTGARQPLAQMLCTDPDLARTDLRFNQAYWALYRQVGEAGQRALKQEDVAFIDAVQQQCVIPKSGALTPEAWEGRDCVRQSYENQQEAWFARLTGPAAEEAARDPERHVTLQGGLRQLGFLAPGDMLDGVYGAATRTAISTWQTSHSQPPTGFLGDMDAIALEHEVGRAPAAPPVAQVQIPPPSEPPVGEGLTVTVIPERTDTALIIKGEIRNEADGGRDVPKLRVAIRDAGETELAMKVVNAPVDRLDAGAAATFETSFDPNEQAVGVAVTFLAPAPQPSTANTAPADAIPQINALLADIYSHYPRAGGRNPTLPWQMPYAAQVFDSPMVALLVDENRLARATGDIIALDADPFCDCQDDEGMRPTVGDIQLTGATTATATVDLRWMCAVSQSPRLSPADRQREMANCWGKHKDGIVDSKQLLFDLVLAEGAWRIHDIHSPTIHSLRDHIHTTIASVRKTLKN